MLKAFPEKDAWEQMLLQNLLRIYDAFPDVQPSNCAHRQRFVDMFLSLVACRFSEFFYIIYCT